MANHKYFTRHLKAREIQYLRELIPDLEEISTVIPHVYREKYNVKISESKLLYQEIHPYHLEYKSIEELRDVNDRGVL